MPHTARRFAEQAMPVGEFMKTLSDGYYWTYERSRNQYMGVENSVASSPEIDTEEQTVWGIEMSEASRYNNTKTLKGHILYSTIAHAVESRESFLDFFRGRPGSDKVFQRKAFRNLTNAWRDEYCLNAPVDADSEERMNTAEWRIVMCYYAIYKAVSAIVHTKESSDLSNSHTHTLDVHASQFMSSRIRGLYGYPFNFHPSSDQFFTFRPPYPQFYGTTDSNTREQLETRREDARSDANREEIEKLYRKAEEIGTYDDSRNTNTFLHLFKLIREWANYGHGGIFSRLYGQGYISHMDCALQLTAYSAIATAEVALICAFGFDQFSQEVAYYRSSCEEGVSDSAVRVDERYDIYERALSDF